MHAQMHINSLTPRALERRWRMLARCGRAWATFKAPLSDAARRAPTKLARQRPCQQVAKCCQSALKPLVEVVVGLVTARDAALVVSPGRAVPRDARRARSRPCEVDMSAHRCKNVHVSSMCSAVEMCVGVCTVGAHARVLARARRCVLRRRRRMSPRAPGAACSASSPGAAVQRIAPRPTRHGGVFTGSFFAECVMYV